MKRRTFLAGVTAFTASGALIPPIVKAVVGQPPVVEAGLDTAPDPWAKQTIAGDLLRPLATTVDAWLRRVYEAVERASSLDGVGPVHVLSADDPKSRTLGFVVFRKLSADHEWSILVETRHIHAVETLGISTYLGDRAKQALSTNRGRAKLAQLFARGFHPREFDRLLGYCTDPDCKKCVR